MIRGKVIGQVWATRQAPGISGQTLLLVAVDGGTRVLAAMDTLDTRVGDRVLVSRGSGARKVLRRKRPGLSSTSDLDLLCDAAISMVVDGASDEQDRGGA
jgi:ethanolamine utilization protein EutN